MVISITIAVGNGERSLSQMFPKKSHRSRKPTRSENIPRDCWENMQKYKQQVSEQGHSKAEMEHWNTVMSEQLGEAASYNQPHRLREKIHTGRSRIKQTHGQALPVKQHPDHNLTAQIVTKSEKDREQPRASSGGMSQKQTHLHHHHRIGMDGVSGEPPKVATRAGVIIS